MAPETCHQTKAMFPWDPEAGHQLRVLKGLNRAGEGNVVSERTGLWSVGPAKPEELI